MSGDRKFRVEVCLTEAERKDLERFAPAYGQDDIGSFLPTIINAGLRWAEADQRKAARDMKRAAKELREKLKKNPPGNRDDDMPF